MKTKTFCAASCLLLALSIIGCSGSAAPAAKAPAMQDSMQGGAMMKPGEGAMMDGGMMKERDMKSPEMMKDDKMMKNDESMKKDEAK